MSIHSVTKGEASSLADQLSKVLPQGYQFGIHHLSTPPTQTDALCSAPPGEREDNTYCENHFLAVTIDANTASKNGPDTTTTTGAAVTPGHVLILAIEILIYTTAYSSTFFVSKADSTGYLALLDLPKGAPSPIREICTTILAYLVQHRRRKGLQCVVSLFARAQDQYLFPLSVQNKSKHVLDDRGLVKWWCRVLHPLVDISSTGGSWADVKGHLVVPGLDKYEMRAFLPRAPDGESRWVLSHPLEKISHYTREYDWVPARCLIPSFPDDPKSRYRDELDEEANRSKLLRTSGMWKSVRSLDQFWEMMAFRQECSSGRLTGFIWVVFEPGGDGKGSSAPTAAASNATAAPSPPSTPPKNAQGRPTTSYSTPRKLFPTSTSGRTPHGAPSKTKRAGEKKKRKKRLTGPIEPRQPHIKTQQRNYLLDRPSSTAYYRWPAEGRGRRVVGESDYKRSIELLLHLDFSTLDRARSSTKRWVSEVGMGESWVVEVVGMRESAVSAVSAAASSGGTPITATGASVNDLSGLVKRKRGHGAGEDGAGQPAKVNVLSAGLVRKKAKQ
ncbi:hypothetical protein SODALDRAFT_329704 [Sodiomyces alkalinus F11]|uniref:histone acetyltransferase n=1 Tax=Sodiomyces alkalinus (strain CBS 110278 / VKM F-3762 / F11) TaxID=1314773 RepID=A0A3N2PJN5_SODAK|nr:hypothetical protein SODALDRAFT_329704 [Sodiomyces alkalinus F11]ROT34594.1 hypothetical protein SODALDRAFT_329704 [Sodiomyces alkalinus F11]